MCLWCWLKYWSPVWGPLFTALVAALGVLIAYRALRGQIRDSNASLDVLRKQLVLSDTSLKINNTIQKGKLIARLYTNFAKEDWYELHQIIQKNGEIDFNIR